VLRIETQTPSFALIGGPVRDDRSEVLWLVEITPQLIGVAFRVDVRGLPACGFGDRGASAIGEARPC
jgi:hypothetical protein